MKNHRRTKKKGGGPKRKTAKNTTAEAVSEKAASPKICPICMENLPKNATKTSCGHRFHKKCLMEWCKTYPSPPTHPDRRVSGTSSHLEPTCPNCRKSISEDCQKMQPGKSMPPDRINHIMTTEEIAHNRYKVDVGGDILEKKRDMLNMLKFPKNYTTSDWTNIHHFSEACRQSINYETVRDMLIERQQREES
jgi:hypothetical protein